MSQNVVFRRLRPYLFTSFKRTIPNARAFASSPCCSKDLAVKRGDTLDYRVRVEHHEKYLPPSQWYPRLRQKSRKRKSIADYRRKYEHVQSGGTDTNTVEIVAGRVQSIRKAGSKLLFIDIKQDDVSLQVLLNVENLKGGEAGAASVADHALPTFDDFESVIRKGDWYLFQGHPHRSKRGELSVLPIMVPQLLSPALHHIPDVLDDPEIRAKNRHVDMLVHPSATQTIRLRHLVEKYIRDFLDNDGFTGVHTPLLSASAGGAVARPFRTEATEFEGQKLELRIAPELWLKRLVVGGMEKVYELGPAFRNEGVDATHNPEFHICEFYEAFAVLDGLMEKTEKLLRYISSQIASSNQNFDALRDTVSFSESATQFERLEFIPALQECLGQNLPDLSTLSAADDLVSIFTARNIAVPSNLNLPRLLDALAYTYLEPLSQDHPIFITHHPACLSPLAKTFICPTTNQLISARAELFIGGREIANMYEEENSPFVQRKKFEEQLKYREVDGEGDAKVVDESYLSALEWGLPPTGGWGCGVDRLVMLFAGRERLGDVLPFGTLRNVVGIGKGRR